MRQKLQRCQLQACRVRYLQDDVLELTKIDYVLNEAVVLDHFVSALWWAAKEQKFTKEQLAAFYTVVHTLLEHVRGTYTHDHKKQLHKLTY